jgi:MYXO-CTERM domain-containing protein
MQAANQAEALAGKTQLQATEQAVSDRSVTFSAADDSGPPASMKTFGVVFGVLWLGMLALVFVARRRQVRLKQAVASAERALATHTPRS